MHARVWIGLALAVAVSGCVPTPAGRASDDSGVVGSAQPSVLPPTAAPGPTAWPSFVRPTPNPGPTFLVHAVADGETLTSIARLYGTTVRSIAYWNRDRYPSLDPDSTTYEPNRIEVGWMLSVIPTEVVDEDELPEATPSPTPSPTPSAEPASPAASAASLP